MALTTHFDQRGCLSVLDPVIDFVPFTIKRIFFLTDVPKHAKRACHAVNCELYIVCIKGKVTIEGMHSSKKLLGGGDDKSCVLIPEMQYLELTDFQDGTLVCVLASKSFQDTKYYDAAGKEKSH